LGDFSAKGLFVDIFIEGLAVLSLNRTKEYFERHPGIILLQRWEHQLRRQSFPMNAKGFECLFNDGDLLLAKNGKKCTFTWFGKVLMSMVLTKGYDYCVMMRMNEKFLIVFVLIV
jgi:hypothetical protein